MCYWYPFSSTVSCNSTAPTVSAHVEILVMNKFPLTRNLSAEAFQAASFMSDKALSWSLLQLPPCFFCCHFHNALLLLAKMDTLP